MLIYIEFTLAMLALGEVLDRTLSDSAKTRIQVALTSGGATSADGLAIARWADRFLGPKLLSWKAVRNSVLISLVAIVAALAAATFPDIDPLRLVYRDLTSNGSAGALAIGLLLAGTITSDYISIAQTRIFARAIGKFKDWGISYLLCIADLFMSIGIFCAVFSLFRLVAYVTVASSLSNGQLIYQSWFAPAVAADIAAMSPLAMETLARPAARDDNPELNVLRVLIAAARRPPFDAQSLSAQIRQVELADRGAGPATYRSSVECYPGASGFQRLFLGDSVYSDTHRLIERGLQSVDALSEFRDSASFAVRSRLDQALESGRPCAIRILGIERTYRVGDLIFSGGLSNAYLASLDATTLDMFHSISTKFSLYATPDLGRELKPFLANTWSSRSTSFLGTQGTDRRADLIAVQIYQARMGVEEHVFVPFSTFATSCVAPSLILFLAVLWNSFARIVLAVRSVVVRSVAPTVGQNIMRAIAAGISITVWLLVIAAYVLDGLWRLLGLLF